jgi:hypothetical protein
MDEANIFGRVQLKSLETVLKFKAIQWTNKKLPSYLNL